MSWRGEQFQGSECTWLSGWSRYAGQDPVGRSLPSLRDGHTHIHHLLTVKSYLLVFCSLYFCCIVCFLRFFNEITAYSVQSTFFKISFSNSVVYNVFILYNFENAINKISQSLKSQSTLPIEQTHHGVFVLKLYVFNSL